MEPERRITEILDKVDSRLDNIDITLAKQSVQLEEHMRRSEANEKAIEILSDKIQPVVTHIEALKLVGKTIVALGSLGFVYELVKWFIERS